MTLMIPFFPLQLLDVVSHLAQQNLRLLVLGRKHMLKGSQQWARNNMVMMQKKADVFFTENMYVPILKGQRY